jgi:quercetin dioxygenase-like cupin family protein
MPSLLRCVPGLAALCLLVFPSAGHGEPHAQLMKGAALFRANDLNWQDPPPSLPKGARIALLEGDLAKEGPFVVRIKFPDGYRIMPHIHPKRERVTVLAGTLYFGMGEKFDENAAIALPAGTFGSWPEGMKHFGWARGETIIQLHGIGPWSIEYVNPEDDPRNKK